MRAVPLSALALGMVTGETQAAAPQGRRTDESSVRIPQTRVHELRSEHVDWDFELWVAEPVPGPMPFPPGPPAVLYVLDANLYFGTAVEMTRLMAQLYGELPPLLVVGLAYDTHEPAPQAELRARDFTPTDDSGFEQGRASMPGAPAPTLPQGRRLGGADRFLDFLEHDAKPFIEANYEVAPHSTLFGSSLGGLFALYAFFERPDLFDAIIATSPAIWWGNERLLDTEQAVAGSRQDISANLVLAVGSLEENPEIPMLAQFKMVTNVERMSERLTARGYPSLELSTLVLDGESHTSVVPVALTRGLRAVLGARRPQP